MKSVWTIALALVVALVFSAGLRAADENKEKTVKGTITCAKCDLKLADKCHTVIKASDGTVYWFDDAGGKKYHSKICQSPMEGEVTGTVMTKDGKEWIKVDKVKFE